MRRTKRYIAAGLLAVTMFLPFGQAWAAEQAPEPATGAESDAPSGPAIETDKTDPGAADEPVADTPSDRESVSDSVPAEQGAPLSPEPDPVPFNLAPPASIKQSLPDVDISTGALSYTVPLRLPVGRRGMQPDISLAYNSQNNEEGSLAGFGWSIALPSIERKNLNGLAKMFSKHDFSSTLGGELTETGHSGQDFFFAPRTETGAFSQYTFHETADGGQWLVRTRQGITYRFGTLPAARLVDQADPNRVFRWYLDSVEDSLGNSVAYSYQVSDGQVYPDAITYTNFDGDEGLFRVAFIFTDRLDITSRAAAGFTVTTRKRLARIEAYIGADLAGAYDLSYAASPANGRSLLQDLQYTGYDAKQSQTSEPASHFGYGQGSAADLLNLIILPTGGRTTVAYASASSYKLPSGASANPRLPFTLQTVSQIAFDDAHGTTWQNTLRYEGGSYYYNGPFDRRFAGFEKVSKVDARGTQTVSYYHQGNGNNAANGESGDAAAKIGKSYKTETLASDGRLFNRIINTWDITGLSGQRAFVKLAQSLQSDYDGNTTHRDKAITYDYDPANGNVLRTTEWGEVRASGSRFTDIGSDSFQTDYQYAGGTALSFLASETIRDQAQAKVAETRHYYDGLPLGQAVYGNETRGEKWIAGTAYAREESMYDEKGLVTAARDARRNETVLTYDDAGMYPVTVTDPLGHVTAAEYDYSSGQKTVMVDPNGTRAVTVFDGLDRPVQQLRSTPDDPAALELSVSFEYDDSPGNISLSQNKYRTADIFIDSYSYFDGFGRKMQDRQRSGGGDQFTVTDIAYGADDVVERRSLPYFGSGSAYKIQALPDNLYTAFEYDGLRRPIAAISAVGTTTTAYDDWKTTVTDAAGMVKDSQMDAYGNLTEVTEHNGGEEYATRYAWSGLRNLSGLTDALGNVRHFRYDGLGRIVLSEDLHAAGDPKFGAWSYAYDPANNLIRRVDPNGIAVAYEYDALNRLLTENASEDGRIETTNIYDDCRNGAGRLCSVETADALITNEYDSLGRVTAVTKRLVDGSFTNHYAYDRRDERISSVNPDGSEIRYGYDEGGNLNSIERKETSDQDFKPVVAVDGYSPAGGPLGLAYGNGAVTHNTYDENELYRLRHKSTEARGVLVQDLEYSYDAVGDITRIVDASATDTAKTVDYAYDGLHRLVQSSISEAAHPDGNDARQTFSYDAIGNIINKSDVGSYRYATDPGSFANPHAVIKAGDTDFTYDNNGNLISSRDRTNGEKVTYQWDYNNRLTRISRPNGNFTYAYDADGQRLISDGAGGRQLTISEEYTVQPQGVDKHIFLDGNAVASVSGSSTKAAPYYIHGDHLAGSNVVTADDQSVDELIDYYAFGSLRLDQQNSDRSEKRKFTGHEFDEGTGLTYANSRYYDARIGRWMSADPLYINIADSKTIEQTTKQSYNVYLIDPQGLNAYSYVKNNPLRYRDITGEYWETVIDVIFLGISLYDYYQNPSWGTGVFVALDAAGVALPIPAVAGYIKNGARVTRIARYFIKIAETGDDAIHLSKVFLKNVGFKFGRRAWSTGEAGNDVASLVAHFFKHADEFNVKSVAEYYNKANDFFDQKQFTHSWKEGSDTVYYNSKNNYLGIIRKDGEISSFYKVTEESKLKAIHDRISK